MSNISICVTLQKAQSATKIDELKIPENFKILDNEDLVQFLDVLKESNQNIVSQLNATLEFIDDHLKSNNILYSGTIYKVIDYELSDIRYIDLDITVSGYSVKVGVDMLIKLIRSIAGWNKACLDDISVGLIARKLSSTNNFSLQHFHIIANFMNLL